MEKHKLDGRAYTMLYLTDQERAVVDAMRMGAKVNVCFHNSSYEAAASHADRVAGTFPNKKWWDITHRAPAFVDLELRSKNVSIDHFIPCTKKATAATVTETKIL